MGPLPNECADSPESVFAFAQESMIAGDWESFVRCLVRGIVDLPAFVAASERFRRRNGGGGSVSSRMFVDERLVDVVVSGKKARGLRRRTVGGDDPIGFVLGRNGWRTRLFGGRSSRAV